jgi:flagellar biogenesis protein FliO
VGALLLFLWWGARVLGRKRLLLGVDQRLVTVVETTYLSQHSTMHVIRIGTRYFAVGGGANGLTLITELEREPLDGWIASQRRQVDLTQMPGGAFFKRFQR